MKKYTVNITKKDGMKSIYYVAALSLGGAETICLNEVYNSIYAIAEDGWPETVKSPDLFSDAITNGFILKGVKEAIKELN